MPAGHSFGQHPAVPIPSYKALFLPRFDPRQERLRDRRDVSAGKGTFSPTRQTRCCARICRVIFSTARIGAGIVVVKPRPASERIRDRRRTRAGL